MKISRVIRCVDTAHGDSVEMQIDSEMPEVMRVISLDGATSITPYHSHTWRLSTDDIEDPQQTDLVLITETHLLYQDEQYKLTASRPELFFAVRSYINSDADGEFDEEFSHHSTYWVYKTGKAEPWKDNNG